VLFILNCGANNVSSRYSDKATGWTTRLGPIQPTTQLVEGGTFAGSKAAVAWGSPLATIHAEVKQEWSYVSTGLHNIISWRAQGQHSFYSCFTV